VRPDPRWSLDEPPLDALVTHAVALSWTRDPFDRLLCAHALLRGWRLAGSDRAILEHLPASVGDAGPVARTATTVARVAAAASSFTMSFGSDVMTVSPSRARSATSASPHRWSGTAPPNGILVE
jgi:hypothetical protein